MNALLFVPRPHPGGEKLLAALSGALPAASLNVVRDWAGFAEALDRASEPASAVIIWNPTNDDLRRAAEVRDRFQRGRLLLGLPDQEAETLVLAHRLLPAFIAYVDDGVAELLSVVGKLTRTRSENKLG